MANSSELMVTRERSWLRVPGNTTVLPLFAITIFLGAVLVFGVQPIAARMLLPYFGGSPAVWSASVLFFQLALLAGYGYSYFLTRHARPWTQALIHLPVLAIPALMLPLSLPVAEAWLATLPPAIGVMAALAIGLGVPFVVASTTGPLLQRWFSFTGHRWAHDPYFLYAASNAGSLLVLLAYPFLLEPRWTLPEQSAVWSVGYLLFAALAAGCAVVVMRKAPAAIRSADAGVDAAPLSWATRGRWLLLAAVPAALSLAVTQHISTDIAAVPLLWIAPLALYLVSFVVAFSPRNPLTPRISGMLLPWALAAVLITPFLEPPVWLLLGVHLAFLFLAAVMCHSRLADERPDPARLTEYYLLLSVGGAIGGAFVSLVAPIIFDRVWEYPVAIIAALILRPQFGGQPSRRLLVGLGATIAIAAVVIAASASQRSLVPTVVPLLALGAAVVAVSRWRTILAVMASIILGSVMLGGGEAIYTERTFFGVYRVTEDDNGHSLVHGTTVHGMQFSDPQRSAIATAYFHPSGPIGQVFEAGRDRFEDVAVIGLGVGTLATYGWSGQTMTFYEIDPAVVALARNRELFTYLADSDAAVETVVADGRLGIAADDAAYDLLVIDAFSSDAIPVHLLTREAVAVYADRLTDGGLIAFHITNRYVDLEPVLGTVARSLGFHALVQGDHTVTPEQAAQEKRTSTWILLAARPENLEPFSADDRWHPVSAGPLDRVWTDGYSDLIGALR